MAEVSFSTDEIIEMVAALVEVSEELLASGEVHLAFAVDGVVRQLTDRLFGAH